MENQKIIPKNPKFQLQPPGQAPTTNSHHTLKILSTQTMKSQMHSSPPLWFKDLTSLPTNHKKAKSYFWQTKLPDFAAHNQAVDTCKVSWRGLTANSSNLFYKILGVVSAVSWLIAMETISVKCYFQAALASSVLKCSSWSKLTSHRYVVISGAPTQFNRSSKTSSSLSTKTLSNLHWSAKFANSQW